MTGTSLDGLDACLARVEGRGLAIRAAPVDAVSIPFGDCVETLRLLASGRPVTSLAVAAASLALGERHAEAVRALRPSDGSRIDLVAAHGQTLVHAPPLSWQALNPWPIVRAAECPVVYDLRGADLAAGGQGAPITPIADWILFRDEARPRVVLNLGGFCNATLIPARQARNDEAWAAAVRGMDVCACNQVLDRAAARALGRPFDASGDAARRGAVNEHARDALAAILRGQSEAKRSLGTGDECAGWVDDVASRLRGDDLLATVAAAVGETIGRRAADLLKGQEAGAAIVAGGGARNRALIGAISRGLGKAGTVGTTDEHGVAVEQREPLCMAVLGALCADRAPITLPAVTGVRSPAPIAGAWAGLTDEGGR